MTRPPFGGGVIGNTTGSGPVIGGSSPPPRAKTADGTNCGNASASRPLPSGPQRGHAAARPHRLEAKDTTLSRWRHGFESRWGCQVKRQFRWRLPKKQPECCRDKRSQRPHSRMRGAGKAAPVIAMTAAAAPAPTAPFPSAGPTPVSRSAKRPTTTGWPPPPSRMTESPAPMW